MDPSAIIFCGSGSSSFNQFLNADADPAAFKIRIGIQIYKTRKKNYPVPYEECSVDEKWSFCKFTLKIFNLNKITNLNTITIITGTNFLAFVQLLF